MRYRGIIFGRGSTVTEAALSNGFHGANCFSELFRRAYDTPPREYQRNAAQ